MALVRVFVIPECQKGFVGGIQQYIFNYAISTHKENHRDVLLCLTPVKTKDAQCCPNKVCDHNNIYCIILYTPSILHAFVNTLKVLARMSKYRKKVEVYSVPCLYSPIFAFLKINQVLFLLQKPQHRMLSFLYHAILFKFDNIRYIASDTCVLAMYKFTANKISVFFPDPSKVITISEGLPRELAGIRLCDKRPVVVHIGYIEHPRFSIPHFIAFLRLLKSLAEKKGKNPLVVLVIRPTKRSDKFMKYLVNKLASLQLSSSVIIINRFLTIEEKLAILKASDAMTYFLLDIKPATLQPTIPRDPRVRVRADGARATLQPTIPPFTLAECIALRKPVILFVNGLDKLEVLGSLYTRWNKYIHVIDISSNNYISDLRNVIENILLI